MEEKQVIIYEGRISSWLNGLLLGALVGAVAALLYTPRSGTETRQLLGEKGTQVRERAIELIDDTRSRAQSAIESARGRVQSVAENVSGELAEENQILKDRMQRTYDL